MGGVKGTRYLLKIRNHTPHTTESRKQCPSAFLRNGVGGGGGGGGGAAATKQERSLSIAN